MSEKGHMCVDRRDAMIVLNALFSVRSAFFLVLLMEGILLGTWRQSCDRLVYHLSNVIPRP